MKTFYLISILAALFLCNSCFFSNCVEVKMANNEINWHKNLPNVGDSIFFKGSDSSIHIFSVNNRYHDFTDCNKIERGKYQYEQVGFSATVTNIKKRSTSAANTISLVFDKRGQEKPNETCNKYLRVFDLYIEGYTTFDKFQEQIIESINGTTKTVFIAASPLTKRNQDSEIKIENFNWSREYGLIRYTTKDSVVYDYWKTKR